MSISERFFKKLEQCKNWQEIQAKRIEERRET